jgi:hypothetical protein
VKHPKKLLIFASPLNNKKFLQMLHGPGGGFFKKSPLAAGGKIFSQEKIGLVVRHTNIQRSKK